MYVSGQACRAGYIHVCQLLTYLTILQGVATSKNTAAHFTGWAKSAGTSGSNCEWYIAPKDFWNTAKGHREMLNHFLC
jgi:hypothetical protein